MKGCWGLGTKSSCTHAHTRPHTRNSKMRQLLALVTGAPFASRPSTSTHLEEAEGDAVAPEPRGRDVADPVVGLRRAMHGDISGADTRRMMHMALLSDTRPALSVNMDSSWCAASSTELTSTATATYGLSTYLVCQSRYMSLDTTCAPLSHA